MLLFSLNGKVYWIVMMNTVLEIRQAAHFKSIFFFSPFVVTLSGVSLTRDEILKSDVIYNVPSTLRARAHAFSTSAHSIFLLAYNRQRSQNVSAPSYVA